MAWEITQKWLLYDMVYVHWFLLFVRNNHGMAPFCGYTSIVSVDRRFSGSLLLILSETIVVVKQNKQVVTKEPLYKKCRDSNLLTVPT